jgi:hypothetical protein
MQPNHEPDELSEVLEAGYAAPPLDAAFSDNLVRRMQAEVLPQSSLPGKRQMRWAVVLCGVGVAASILAVIYVASPLGTKAARDEVAMHSVPGSSFELSSSIESKSTRSLETASIPTNDAKVSEIKPLDVPPAKSRGGEAARGTLILESKLESRTEVPRGIVKKEESKANDSYRSLLKFENMSVAVMEEVEVVTKERAKALGLSIISQPYGPDAVRVNLEFEKQGELKEYRSAQLRQFDGDKLLLSVTLQEGKSKPSRVIVGLVAARSNLATLSLDIVAMNARGSRVRYVLPMKDFVTKPEGLTQP